MFEKKAGGNKSMKSNGYHDEVKSSTSQLTQSNGHVTEDAEISSWESCLPVPRLNFLLAAGIVFCLAVLCFANSHDGDFAFDDSEAILNNKDLLPETPLEEIFSHDFWGRKLDSKTSHKSYRPLTILTYRWNYYMAGELKPWGFHVVNIILHGVVSVLFLCVFSILLAGHSTNPVTGYPAFHSPRTAFLCAVLFAVHPIHTESVAGVVGRADLLCALTFLLSFICYARSCLNQAGDSYRPTGVSFVWMLCCIVLCVMSTFCKEQGITVIGICSVFDIIVVCRVDPLQVLHIKRPALTNQNDQSSSPGPRKPLSANQNGHCSSSEHNKPLDVWPSWIKSLILRQMILLLTGVFLLVTRWRVMGSETPIFQVHDNPQSFINSTLYRTVNYNYLFAINLWILFDPLWLCFDWSMGCVPLITSLADYRILSIIALWILIGCLVFKCFRDDFTKDQRVLILSMALLVVPFLPASNLFFRVGFVIAERILYLSSAGFCMLVALGAKQLSTKPFYRQFVQAGFVFITVIFMIRSVQRSNDWRGEMKLFTAGENVCPLNAKVHYNIAKLQCDNNNTELAIEKYRLAIRLNNEYDQAMNNLANVLKDRGDVIEAESLLLRAVQISPEFAAAWMNLGIVQAELKKNTSAEYSYLQALRHRHNYPDCYYNLGNLYLDTGRPNDALMAWRNSTWLKSTHVNAWTNSLILLDNLGWHDDAIRVGLEALKVLTHEPQIYFNLANIYGKMERHRESEHMFLKSIELNSNNARFHLNLGVLYHRWGKLESAELSYRKALQLEPNEPSTEENLRMLYRKMGKHG